MSAIHILLLQGEVIKFLSRIFQERYLIFTSFNFQSDFNAVADSRTIPAALNIFSGTDMAENNSKINAVNNDLNNPPSLNITESSRILLTSIEDILVDLVNRADLSPSDDEFYYKYRRILDIYDHFQNEVIDASGISTVCSAGCSSCCCHWVEDVNSFEAYIIGRYLNENSPDMIDSVIMLFREDAEVLNSLRDIVDGKSAEYTSVSDEITDQYDLLLACFYQLERPCALLDDNGCCSVYPVRPFTCRDYMNIRDKTACLPDRIIEGEPATLILYLSDFISQQLEILHRRFDDGSDDMSLRSLLVRFFESGESTVEKTFSRED